MEGLRGNIGLAPPRIAISEKILRYFIDPEDVIPDTAPCGYLDDLYVLVLGFKRIRQATKDKIQTALLEAVNQ